MRERDGFTVEVSSCSIWDNGTTYTLSPQPQSFFILPRCPQTFTAFIIAAALFSSYPVAEGLCSIKGDFVLYLATRSHGFE